jgi:hypothetical protein
MPNPRANRPLTLDRVVEDLKSFSVPAQGLFDAMAGALRGSAVGTFGAPGDIETLARMGVNAAGGSFNPAMPSRSGRAFQPVSEEPFFPSSEELAKRFPPTIPNGDPVRQKSAGPFEELGQFAPLPLSGKALKVLPYALGRGAGMATKEAARAINDAMVYQTGPLSQGPLSMLAPKGAVSHVVKPKGGNWLNSGSVARVVDPLKSNLGVIMSPAEIESHRQAIETAKRIIDKYGGPEAMPGHVNAIRQMQGEIDQALRSNAINSWADRNLTNYIKNQMGTPEDPVRRLAEEGIVHIPTDQVGLNRYKANTHRATHGGEQLGKSEAARAWEDSADVSIEPMEIKGMHPDYREPWMEKADPKTKIYEPTNQMHGHYLGFNHIMDVLREDLASGRIRPEQLSKVSMEQAVRRTYEYDQELAAKMSAARAAKREGLPVQKEYPEGYRWVELNRPGAFASESEAMGHSVRGYEPPRGHPDWTEGSGDSGSSGYGHGGWEAIKSGKAKVYSLVDPKGEPHVTVEVGEHNPNREFLYAKQNLPELYAKYSANRNKYSNSWPDFLKAEAPELLEAKERKITQIKGKQNAAPKEEYLPFVQDFVKGGQWSDVGDIHNTGLIDAKHWLNPTTHEKYLERGLTVPKYATEKELDELHNEYLRFAEPQNYKPPEDGMKRGGSVHISDNPDTMMMEVGDQHFGVGGAALKTAKLLRAPAKTKTEIEAIAQRMAPQITGEYVRGKEGAKTVAGKTQKQFEREKTLEHDIRPTAGERPAVKPVDIETLKGNVMLGISGDPTITGQTVHGVAGRELRSPAPQHGGPLYGLGREDDAFWASNLGAASGVQGRVKEASDLYEAPVIGNYVKMGPDSYSYAQHFADTAMQAIDPSKMTKRQIDGINNMIRNGYTYRDSNKVLRQRVFPSFPGIENPDEMYLHMTIDPELRTHFGNLMQMPTVTEKFNLPSGLDVAHAVSEPDIRDLEIGVTGKALGRMKPEAGELKLSTHPTYTHDIPGEFIGGLKYPVPHDLMFPDTLKAVRENPKQAPQEFGSFKMVGPRQIIDPQAIDEIKEYEEFVKKYTGKKEGGEITVKPKKDGQKFKPGKKPDQILKHGQAIPRGKDPEVDIGQIVPQMSAGGKLSKVALEAIQRMKAMRPEIAAKSSLEQKALAENTAKYARDIQPFSMTDEEVAAEMKRLESKGLAGGGAINADDLILEERRL